MQPETWKNCVMKRVPQEKIYKRKKMQHKKSPARKKVRHQKSATRKNVRHEKSAKKVQRETVQHAKRCDMIRLHHEENLIVKVIWKKTWKECKLKERNMKMVQHGKGAIWNNTKKVLQCNTKKGAIWKEYNTKNGVIWKECNTKKVQLKSRSTTWEE